MGKTFGGIFGDVVNKVGNVVFRVSNGNNVVTKYQPIVKNPQSPGQTSQRVLFTAITQLCYSISLFWSYSIKIAFKKNITPSNCLTSASFKNLPAENINLNDFIQLSPLQSRKPSINRHIYNPFIDVYYTSIPECRFLAPVSLKSILCVLIDTNTGTAKRPLDAYSNTTLNLLHYKNKWFSDFDNTVFDESFNHVTGLAKFLWIVAGAVLITMLSTDAWQAYWKYYLDSFEFIESWESQHSGIDHDFLVLNSTPRVMPAHLGHMPNTKKTSNISGTLNIKTPETFCGITLHQTIEAIEYNTAMFDIAVDSGDVTVTMKLDNLIFIPEYSHADQLTLLANTAVYDPFFGYEHINYANTIDPVILNLVQPLWGAPVIILAQFTHHLTGIKSKFYRWIISVNEITSMRDQLLRSGMLKPEDLYIEDGSHALTIRVLENDNTPVINDATLTAKITFDGYSEQTITIPSNGMYSVKAATLQPDFLTHKGTHILVKKLQVLYGVTQLGLKENFYIYPYSFNNCGDFIKPL